MSGAAGWSAARARTTVAAATNSSRWSGTRCSTCWRRSSRGCATRTGIGAIFGGSYGWSSAGRFHHAQSQIHRFLNTALGGYVRSVNSYSAGASNVLLPHILGGYDDVTRRNVSWDDIVQYTDIVVAFGGMATKNSRVASGGISEHTERKAMGQARKRGTTFVLVSPQRSDLPAEAEAEWLAPVPGTDVALMLGIAHTLVAENLHDRAFLDSHCTGWSVFEDYLMGRSDGVPKTAAWAASICGIAASEIAGAGAAACRQARADRGRRTRCSAPSTASSRSGWRRCWRRCWARWACRAAATTTRSARSPTTASG